MQTADDALRAGDTAEALRLLQNQVRAHPADPKPRIFLFQLLAVLGQWERALNQLQVAGELDAGTLGMVQVYRTAVQCEVFRAEVFAGRRAPLIFGQPEPWMALLLEALRHTANQDHRQAAALREQAFEEAPATPGRVNDEPCAWIGDADTRLGPLLEAVVEGRYWWIPFQRIARLTLEPPADLRDLVWLPAQFVWSNGGEAVGLIPSRYPGSESRSDSRLALARLTEWESPAEGVYLGRGQRLLATDQAEYPLLEIRHLVLGASD